jgi:hypothetical protein
MAIQQANASPILDAIVASTGQGKNVRWEGGVGTLLNCGVSKHTIIIDVKSMMSDGDDDVEFCIVRQLWEAWRNQTCDQGNGTGRTSAEHKLFMQKDVRKRLTHDDVREKRGPIKVASVATMRLRSITEAYEREVAQAEGIDIDSMGAIEGRKALAEIRVRVAESSKAQANIATKVKAAEEATRRNVAELI